MLLVGLTGNYGCGKSTVLKIFRNLGALTFDSDAIVASLLREVDVLKQIRKRYGEAVFRKDGRLNKKRLASIIFADATARRTLENILHPRVFKRIRLLLEQKKPNKNIAIVEAPVLFERRYEKKFDRIITVVTGEQKALQRLEKKGIKREEAIQRMRAQLPIREKIERSDYVIDNHGSFKRTEQQVERIFRKLIEEDSRGDCRRT